MTDQSSVFSTEVKEGEGVTTTSTSSTNAASPVKDDLATLLESIRNERGEQKYDNPLKALEGLRHAQEFIPQLKSKVTEQEQELIKLREALAKHESVEDVVARLTASQATTVTSESGLDEQKVSALFDQLLSKRETTLRTKANQEAVQEELVTKFGNIEAANKAVIAKAKELGTTAEEIGVLSSQNPKMVLELFKAVQAVSTGSPPSTTVNSDGFLSKKTETEGLKPPSKSLLAGATYKEQKAYLDQVRAEVYRKYGVTT